MSRKPWCEWPAWPSIRPRYPEFPLGYSCHMTLILLVDHHRPTPIDSGDRLNMKANGAMNTSIPTPTHKAAVSQPHRSTATESSGTMNAPPSLNAALLMDMATPRLRENHVFIAVVEACMKLVEDPSDITNK